MKRTGKYHYVKCPECKAKRAVFISSFIENVKKESVCFTCRRRKASKEVDAIITRNNKLKRKFDKLFCDLNGVCSTIKAHHDMLLDDPERLSTEFIIRLTCGNEGVEKYKNKSVIK